MDIKEVEKLLNKDNISETDLFYANKIIKQWENVSPSLFTESELNDKIEGKYTANVQAIKDIENTFDDLRVKYTRIFENAVLEMFKRYGVEATSEQIFGAKKEIGTLSANLMDISRTDDVILQTVSKIIKDAAFDTEREVLSVVKQTDDLFEPVKNDPLYKQHGFDIFAQEIDGKKTGNLITRFSQEFYDEATKLRAIARNLVAVS